LKYIKPIRDNLNGSLKITGKVLRNRRFL